MKTVDQRVVEANFDGSKFEAGVSRTLSALAKLKDGLQLNGATKGLADITAAAERTDLSAIAESTEHIASKFNGMTAVATAALSRITFAAVDAGGRITKSLGFGAIMEGWSDYELKIGATQTIMSGTGESIGNVTKHLKELDIYADETIYSLSDMVSNIGKFTNAGVKLPVAVNAMKGISNVAAISGANTGEAARAMYNLGQAIGQGTVRLMDWRSVELANMGTKEFKEELIQSAEAMGTLTRNAKGNLQTVEGTEVTYKNFTASLQDQWLTAEALTKTLERYADENTDVGKRAYKAAKDVKSFSMMVTTLKAAMGTGWTDTFDIIVGDLPEATKMWTQVTDVIGAAIGRSADARNKLLKDWDKLGGRTSLIAGIGNAFEALMSVVRPLQDAFREIFPRQTAEGLFAATVAMQNFFMNLKIGADTAENLKRTFAGLFAVFGIVFEIVKQVVSTIFDLVGAFTEGGSGVLEFTGNMGDFLVQVHKALVEGGSLADFFNRMKDILRVPINLIRDAGKYIGRLFTSFDNDKGAEFTDALDKIGERLTPIQKLVRRVGDAFRNLGDYFSNAGSKIADALSGIGDAVAKAFTAQNFSQVLDTLNTGLLAAIAYSIKRFFAGGISINAGSGFLGGLREAVAELTDVMEAMQMKLKAQALLAIAGAIALLTASIVVLSMIDSGALTKAIAAMGAGFAVLIAGMIKLEQGSSILGTLKLSSLARSMVLIGGALLLVATAMKIFASMSAGDTFQGLFALGGSLTAIAGAMRLMPKGMIGQAAALTILGVALNAIAVAMKIFGTMDYAEIARGIVALAGSLVVISGAMRLMPNNMVMQAAALILVGGALNMIAAAMKIFGTMSYDDIARGLVALGGAMIIVAGAMQLMPNGVNMLLQAVALNAVAIAIGVLAGAVMLMGSMGWDEIAKGLFTLGGSLVILAAGLFLMTGSLMGSAALLVAAGALAILTPVLVTLGNMSWQSIVTGLLALVGVFTVLGLAGLVLTPVVPTILGLAAAIALLGVGVALVGAGVMLFSMGLSILVGVLKTSGDTLISWAKSLIHMIPMTIKAIGKGLVELVKIVGRSGKAFYQAFSAIIGAGLDALIENTPKIGKAFTVLITTGLKVLRKIIPDFVETGLELIEKFLTSIRDHIGDIVRLAGDIIVEFINGIADKLPDIIDAGFKLVISFMNGIGDAARENGKEVGEAGRNMAEGIIQGFKDGINALAGDAIQAVKDMASNALKAAKNFLGISSPSKEFHKVGMWSAKGFANGLVGGKEGVIAAWNVTSDLLKSAMESSADNIDRLKEKLKSLEDARKKDHAAINKTKSQLDQARSEYERSNDALTKLNKGLDDKQNRLLKLGRQYDVYTSKISRANEKLKDAIKTRDDYNKSIRDQYDDLPDVSEETNLDSYINELTYANADVLKFTQVLQKLAKLGLSDAVYQDLLAKGPDALPFAEQLLAGGKAGVKQVNNLTGDLAEASKNLGSQASKELYQSGVNAAQGLVDGLEKKRNQISKKMREIARDIVRAIRKELDIKSPSRVMDAIGGLTGMGLVNGLKRVSPVVDKTAAGIADKAVESMKSSFATISELSPENLAMAPTITPVLDLSAVEKEAARITSLLPSQQIAVDASYSKAIDVAALHEAIKQAAIEASGADLPSAPGDFQYIQNNYSPKALPTGEIYRQTKSQLSTVKGALTGNVAK